MERIGIIGVLLIVGTYSQLMHIKNEKEHTFLYNIIIPKKEFRIFYYFHDSEAPDCIATLEFYSAPLRLSEWDNEPCMTQIEVFSPKDNSKPFENFWFRADDSKYSTKKQNMTIDTPGVYRVRVTNLDNLDLATSFISRFDGCQKHKQHIAQEEMKKTYNKYETLLTGFMEHLISRESEDVTFDSKIKQLKGIHSKMLYGILGEILAIISISWWQVFYLISLLENKIVL